MLGVNETLQFNTHWTRIEHAFIIEHCLTLELGFDNSRWTCVTCTQDTIKMTQVKRRQIAQFPMTSKQSDLKFSIFLSKMLFFIRFKIQIIYSLDFPMNWFKNLGALDQIIIEMVRNAVEKSIVSNGACWLFLKWIVLLRNRYSHLHWSTHFKWLSQSAI